VLTIVGKRKRRLEQKRPTYLSISTMHTLIYLSSRIHFCATPKRCDEEI
jgi:hypothetical protein